MLAVAAVIVLLTVGSPLFGHGVLHPADVIEQAAPWRADTEPDFRPQNSLLTDVADAATPNRSEIRQRFFHGDYALWNPYAAGGSPLGTQPHNGLLSPLQLPYLLLPAWYAPEVAKLLQMLVAFTFTFLFLRRVGLRRPAALIGGAIFANSAFLVVWTGFPHSDVAVLIPALFWSVERAIALRTIRASLAIAVVLASMLLSGFPVVAGYAGLAVAAYTVVRLGVRRRAQGRAAMPTRLIAVVALGAGLGAVQLLPFASSLNGFDRSYRAQTSTDVEPTLSLATWAIPSAYGPLGTTGYTSMSGVENQTFAGASTLILMLGALLPLPASGLLRRTRLYLWVGVAALFTLMFLGGPPLVLVQKALPFVFGQNRIGRLDSVLGFFVAALAAIGFQAFTEADRPAMSKAARVAWGVVCAAAVACAVFGVAFLVHVASDAGQRRFLVRQFWIPAIAAGVSIAALLIGRSRRPGGFHPLVWVAPVAFAVESIVFATGFLPRIDRSDFYPVTATHRFLAAHIGHDRLAAEGSTMWPGTQTYYGLRTVASHAFHPEPWLQLLRAAGVQGGYETQPQLSAEGKTASSPIFDRLGVRFWVVRPELLPYGERAVLSTGVRTIALEPGRPLLHPAPPRTIRAVIVTLADRFDPHDDRVYIEAELLGRNGAMIARGERRLREGRAGSQFAIPVAEPAASAGSPRAIRLTMRGRGQALRLSGFRDVPAMSVVFAQNDGLRLEFAGGAVVYRRLAALPRIRWAPGSPFLTPDPGRRIELLSQHINPGAVMLSTPGPAGSGKPASLHITEDSGDAIKVRVRAQGRGYLVVADSIKDGWRATMDGRPARIVPADHAIGALYVPKGEHSVALIYRPKAWRNGQRISLASLVVLGALVIATRRRGRATAPEDGALGLSE